MAILEINSESLTREIRERIKSEWLIGCDSIATSEAHGMQSRARGRAFGQKTDLLLPTFPGRDPHDRASELLEWLIDLAARGEPTLCRYKAAYQAIFLTEGYPYSQAYTAQVMGVAEGTPMMPIDGLGAIRLDGFIVNATGRPGVGHWAGAPYEKKQWERAFGAARVLQPVSPGDWPVRQEERSRIARTARAREGRPCPFRS